MAITKPNDTWRTQSNQSTNSYPTLTCFVAHPNRVMVKTSQTTSSRVKQRFHNIQTAFNFSDWICCCYLIECLFHHSGDTSPCQLCMTYMPIKMPSTARNTAQLTKPSTSHWWKLWTILTLSNKNKSNSLNWTHQSHLLLQITTDIIDHRTFEISNASFDSENIKKRFQTCRHQTSLHGTVGKLSIATTKEDQAQQYFFCLIYKIRRICFPACLLAK